MKKITKERKGFTLIELVITLTIVVILSLISWPIYRSYHLREISVLAEGYALLGAIKDAQIHYYNEYGNFLHGAHSYHQGHNEFYYYTAIDPVLGINVMNNRYFSWFKYDANFATYSAHKYSFNAMVLGKINNNNVVTLIYPFNLTQRGDLTIIGNGATTVTLWNH
ncbi:MAG: prepilin-type N-terminal cleavage/methylation domain-containing protein [Elusimicrobia bacterium]|nr:prepilin-type N-terminal cleavage/methylation domain-containing protein [Elusimicrobiota bacterium]